MCTCLNIKFKKEDYMPIAAVKPKINVTKLVFEAKTDAQKQELIRKYPSIFKDVFDKELTKTYLFPTTHYQDNSIDPPKELQHLLDNIELASQEDVLSEFDAGVYDAVTKLLAAPLALIQTEAKELLETIMDNLIDADDGLVADDKPEDEDDACILPEFKGKPTIIASTSDDDISDDEMLASFKEPTVLQGE